MHNAEFISPKDLLNAASHPEGVKRWRSPSNIALIKYWGKMEVQIPANPSISFTLSDSYTDTSLFYHQKEDNSQFSIELYFEGQRNETFETKIIKFFERISPYFSFLKSYHFKIETSNSFPHSSGIASSASGMSALALCLCSIEQELTQNHDKDFFFKKASFISRLGSGSACRSVYGGLVVWGAHENIENSNDEWAIPYNKPVSEVFNTFQDTILLVDKGSKKVSSTLGHSLMDGNPFSEKRFEVARKNLKLLEDTIAETDLKSFGKLVEQEALMLHALMMTSDPYFILFKPNTLHIIEKVWAFRNQNNISLYTTLDAGANVHLLYPESEKEIVMDFIKSELIGYCENMQYICDRVGSGPIELKQDD